MARQSYEDLINRYGKDKKVHEKDKSSFFDKLKKYIGVRELNILWHIVMHPKCARSVFGIKEIALITAAVAYVIWPLDAVPDYIPIFGLLDDAGVVGYISKKFHDSMEKYERICMEKS